MIQKLKSVRKYDKNLMLIHELYNEKYEYIANYDSNGNLIYSKNWDIGKKKYNIDYEYEQRFGPQNRLIYYKNLNDEDDEIYYEYNNNGKLIYKRYWKDQFTKYIYNSNGNLIQEVDENEKILQEYKYDNIQRLISSNNYIYTYLSNNKVLATYNNDTKTILFNPYVNIIEVNRCKYSDEYSIIIFDKNYNIIFALDSNFNILANVMYNSKGLPISSLFYDTYETYTYDDHDKLLRTEVRNNLSGAVEEIIDYENIYEKD